MTTISQSPLVLQKQEADLLYRSLIKILRFTLPCYDFNLLNLYGHAMLRLVEKLSRL